MAHIRIEYFSLFLFSFFVLNISAQEIQPQHIANYNMDVLLDVDNKMLSGKTILSWRNISNTNISELYFHMYYNAFRNTESTFFKEKGVPNLLSEDIDQNCGWSWSEITNIKDQFDNDLTSNISYVAPDDNNTKDRTVLHIKLVKPVEAGQMQTFVFNWQAKIPRTMPRTGYNMDYYFFAQWFPKLGVLETSGMRYSEETNWNCHQYHSSGEYYSDFGIYEVKLTVPSDFEIAASGELIGQSKKDAMKTWTFRANDVIDFAWSASPHFVVHESKYKNTNIRLYIYPEKAHFSTRYFDAIHYCMEFMEQHLGPYPYSTLSIVDPPVHGMFTGGMEYPTLVTSLTFTTFPAGFKTAETLVMHEFIHQYFMQMVATHEVEEPWMDEGITTYYENRILDKFMGKRHSFIDFAGIKIGSKEYNRGEFFGSHFINAGDNTLKSWEFKNGGYKEISYNKTAIWLQTLEGLVGTDVMDSIMKTYFQRWKFKHPCRQDFIDVVNELVLENLFEKFSNGMDWYFDQVLYGTETCDYILSGISEIPSTDIRGYVEDNDDCQTKTIELSDSIRTNILVKRDGGIKLPVEIKVNFQNDSSIIHHWDGQDRFYNLIVKSDSKVVSAEIDPSRKIYLDRNFINNSMALEQDKKGLRLYIAHWMDKLMHGFELMTLVI